MPATPAPPARAGEFSIELAPPPPSSRPLCTADRIRFPTDQPLLLREAHALHDLGFVAQADYRLKEREALGGEAIVLH